MSAAPGAAGLRAFHAAAAASAAGQSRYLAATRARLASLAIAAVCAALSWHLSGADVRAWITDPLILVIEADGPCTESKTG